MLFFRHDEKLLDALLSLSEIFRLVSYREHVPYALLKSCPWRASIDPGLHCASIQRPRTAAFRFLCSLLHTRCRHSRSAVAKCIKHVMQRSRQIGLSCPMTTLPSIWRRDLPPAVPA